MRNMLPPATVRGVKRSDRPMGPRNLVSPAFPAGLPTAEVNLITRPSGKWMVYADYPRHHLWRSKLDGSQKLQLTDIYSAMPQWSPVSKSIVFSDWNQLYLVPRDGGIPEKLLADPNNDVAPSWWPDGKSIAFNDFPRSGQEHPGIKVLDLATQKVSIMSGSEGTRRSPAPGKS